MRRASSACDIPSSSSVARMVLPGGLICCGRYVVGAMLAIGVVVSDKGDHHLRHRSQNKVASGIQGEITCWTKTDTIKSVNLDCEFTRSIFRQRMEIERRSTKWNFTEVIEGCKIRKTVKDTVCGMRRQRFLRVFRQGADLLQLRASVTYQHRASSTMGVYL